MTELRVKDYVAGFLFDSFGHVLLVHKKHGPDIVVGKLNAIGGQVNSGEAPLAAMEREFREETGMEINTWRPRLILAGESWRVFFFTAIVAGLDDPKGRVNDVGEELKRYHWSSIKDELYYRVVPNLRWIIPMMMDAEVGFGEVACRS